MPARSQSFANVRSSLRKSPRLAAQSSLKLWLPLLLWKTPWTCNSTLGHCGHLERRQYEDPTTTCRIQRAPAPLHRYRTWLPGLSWMPAPKLWPGRRKRFNGKTTCALDCLKEGQSRSCKRVQLDAESHRRRHGDRGCLDTSQCPHKSSLTGSRNILLTIIVLVQLEVWLGTTH